MYKRQVWYRDAYDLLTSRGLRPANAPESAERRGLFSRLPFVGGGEEEGELVQDKDATLRPPTTN